MWCNSFSDNNMNRASEYSVQVLFFNSKLAMFSLITAEMSGRAMSRSEDFNNAVSFIFSDEKRYFFDGFMRWWKGPDT